MWPWSLETSGSESGLYPSWASVYLPEVSFSSSRKWWFHNGLRPIKLWDNIRDEACKVLRLNDWRPLRSSPHMMPSGPLSCASPGTQGLEGISSKEDWGGEGKKEQGTCDGQMEGGEPQTAAHGRSGEENGSTLSLSLPISTPTCLHNVKQMPIRWC